MSADRFNRLVGIYRSVQIVGNSRRGILSVRTEHELIEVNIVLSDPAEYGIVRSSVDGRAALVVGDAIEVELYDPRTAIGLLADSFDDVLRFQTGYVKESRYYLLPRQWASIDSLPPEIVVRYRAILSLVKLLEESSAYLDKDEQQLVFIDEGKFLLPVRYDAELLISVDLACVQSIMDRFGNDTHREQKLTVVAKAIQRICGPIKSTNRFEYLISQMQELLKQLDEGYRLYVADFSYEKILDQMETAKLEELAKIHKNFSDIQNQILGIPVATVVVATQLKESTGFDFAFWVNSAIMTGVWIFALLTNLVLRNQRHSLDALAAEIDRKERKVNIQYAKIKNIVGTIFPQLRRRLRDQRVAFWTVDLVVVVGVVLAHMMYFAITGSAYDLLHRYFHIFH